MPAIDKNSTKLQAYYKVDAKKGKFICKNGNYEALKDTEGNDIYQNEFEGYLRGIEFREGEYDGEPVYSIRFQYGEFGLEEIVEFGMNSCSLSFLNTLSEKDLNGKVLTFSLWKGKDKDGKEYRSSNISCKLNDEKISWAYDYKKVSSMLDQNKTKVVDAWKKMIDAINAGLSPKSADTPKAVVETTKTEAVAETVDESGLPF